MQDATDLTQPGWTSVPLVPISDGSFIHLNTSPNGDACPQEPHFPVGEIQ